MKEKQKRSRGGMGVEKAILKEREGMRGRKSMEEERGNGRG